MAKKYVPEGVFLACDKGTSVSTLRVTNNCGVSIYGVPEATEADKEAFFNIKPMGLCNVKLYQGCIPMVPQWDNPKDGVTINGNRKLLEDSTCQCMLGGKITIHFTRESAVAASAGNGKMPTDYIKGGFDWLFDQSKQARAERDKHLPEWMQSVAHVGDWFEDASVSLVEGAVNGVVGLGETIYQVAQDPVGTAEALGGMTKDAYNATKEGLGDAWDWASDGDNWKEAASDTWDWASDGDNWKEAASDAWEGTKDAAEWVKDNPRKLGNTVGEFIPDAAAAYFTAGGSLAASGTKKVVKEGLEEVVEEALEKGVKEGLEEVGEAGLKKTGKELLESLADDAADIPRVVTKTAREKIEEAMKKFDPKTASNKQKGNFGEMASQEDMLKNTDLKRIGDEAPTSLDDKLKKGIDGIYENSNPPPKYIIDEAKYGTSELNPNTSDGPQMSDKWVKKRLGDQVDPDKADDIMRSMDKGEVDKVVSKVDEAGNVTRYRVDENGKIIGPWP